LKGWVGNRIGVLALGDPGDHVRELIRREHARARKIAAMQLRVDEGLASGVSESTMDAIAAEASERLRTGPR
jgi:antitoxin ParD1/3/4